MESAGVWLVGVGPMAVEYAKVLRGIGVPFLAIGRGEMSAATFAAQTGIRPVLGGLEAYLLSRPPVPEHVIVCVGVEGLYATSLSVLRYGARTVLVEKPGGLGVREIEDLAGSARAMQAGVWIAYNRRFYASVQRAAEIAREDGGVRSFTFDFTEWSHVVVTLPQPPRVKARWVLANSSHVIDLAFFLGGRPKRLETSWAGGLTWHPSASIFAGAGEAEGGALFSYQANWEAPGRWGVELCTRRHRLILRPLETLQVQELGSVTAEPVDLADALDRAYKTGLYNQVLAFLGRGDGGALCPIEEQAVNAAVYNKMANY